MPRDLIDLMESATSFAPPETHHADDITRLAARRQRRRTSGIAAGLTAAVLVAAAAGYGVTRGHDTTPEPADHYKYDQQRSLEDAVPVGSDPDFHELHYALPPEDATPGSGAPYTLYTDIDSAGRLVVLRHDTGAVTAPAAPLVLDTPDSTSSSAAEPPSPGRNGSFSIAWMPRFTDEGRLLWTPSAPVVHPGEPQLHVTDLDGGNDRALHVNTSRIAVPDGDPRALWVSGDRLWLLNQQPLKGDDLTSPPPYNLYSVPIDRPADPTLVADHLVGAAGSGGVVGWVTDDGRGFLGEGGGPMSSFALPLDEGCSVYPFAGQFGQIAVTQGLLAFTEQCGSGKSTTQEAVVVDESGRVVLHVATAAAFDYSLTGGAFAFAALDGRSQSGSGMYRADLRSGSLVLLGNQAERVDWSPEVAGRYVLWHDSDGFRVGEFAD